MNSLDSEPVLERNTWYDALAVRRSLGRILGVAVAAAGLAGCATQQAPVAASGATGTAEEQVAARSRERWQALIAGDVPKAYEYLSPGSKTVYPLEVYRSGIRPGFWKAADVEKVECAADLCEVTTVVTYVYIGTTIKSPAKESWIREKGIWWYLHKS
jgi:hypothetical protein